MEERATTNRHLHAPSKFRASRTRFVLVALLVLITAASVSARVGVGTQPSNDHAPSAASLTNCGAPVHVTIAQLESLTNNTIVPDKRSLTPPCSVTYNGQTYSTYVEMDNIKIEQTPFTGDCDTVSAGYCDVHLEFACAVSAGCLFEIDQTWFAAGYFYPVNTQGVGSVNAGTVVNATGFLYLDDHGIHELHPTVSVSVQGIRSGGGTSSGSGGGCFCCDLIPQMTIGAWLFSMGVIAMALIAPLLAMTLRARSKLNRVRKNSCSPGLSAPL